MKTHSCRRSTWLLVLALSMAAATGRVLAGAPTSMRLGTLDAKADARLAQAVVLSVRGEPLGEALRGLTERTGVRLEVASGVADLKVTLLAREMPLHRTLAEVAQLLNLTWLRRGAAPNYRYECARDVAAVRQAQAALEQARAVNRASVLAQITRVAEAMRKGETAGLAATDPEIAAALNDPNRGEATRQMFGYLSQIPPEALQELVRAGRITTNYDQMPPEARETVRRATEQFLPLALANIRGPDGNSPGYETFLKSASYTLGVQGLDYGGNTYFGEMRAGGMSMRFAIELGTSTTAPPSMPNASGIGGAAATVSPRPRRPLPPISATLEGGKPMSVREIADWLAEKTPLAVVSDYYATRYERRQIPVPPDASVEAVLAAMERYAEVTYTPVEDHVIRLRSRRWSLDDLMEPPPAAVKALEDALRTNGRLGLEEYLLAARLTDAQCAGLARMDEARFGQLGRALDGSRPLVREALRFTAALSPAQRAAAHSPTGLSFAQLNPAQRTMAAAAVARQIPEIRPQELTGAVFSITREERASPLAGSPLAPAGTGPVETYVFRIQLPGTRRTFSTSLALGPVAAGR